MEESAGGNALVLELVEGPTLAERIAQGAIPLDDVLPIAKQIAEALGAAHEHGIIHRDLKPANIKLTADGKVKVLDFGLAKALDRSDVGRNFSSAGSAGSEKQDPAYALSASPTGLSASPTITSPAMTMGGVILGTAAYMSPEQAKGKAADKRADIWAFGCVLYEMLTGRKAFDAEDVSDTMAAVLRADPDWGALPANVSPQIRRLLRRCLTRDLRERLHDIGDARLDVVESLNAPAESGAIKPRPRLHPALAAVTLAAVAAVGLAAYAVWIVRQQASNASDARFDIAVPQGRFSSFFAISPDGRYVAYTAPSAAGRTQALWLRPINSLNVRMLQGTEGAAAPFWSPDSRSLAFFVAAESLLKRVDVSGDGAPILVVDFRSQPGTITARGVPGGAWNRDGTIITGGTGGIRRFSASGGDLTRITEWDETLQETAHGYPSFLPDGHHFLYRALSAKPENQAIYVASLDSKIRKKLLTVENGAPAIYAAPGFIVFLRGTTLMARPFDAERLEFTGDARTLAEGVASAPSASDNGTLLYRRQGPRESNRQLLWIDRTGKSDAIDVQLDIIAARLSPDGTRVAFAETSAGGRSDIYVYSIERGMKTGLTNDASIDASPIWSPDGSKVIFASNRTERMWALYETSAAGPTRERLLVPTESGKTMVPLDWSKDGKVLLFTKEDTGRPGPAIQRDIWMLPLTGDQKSTVYLQTPFDEGQATLSPNGKWVAYTSNESGAYHVIVRSFPDATREKYQISTSGGTWPRWSRDGHFLYHVDSDGRLLAVPVKTEPSFEVGTAVPLFEFPLPPATTATPNVPYDVAADGRFLVSAPAATDERASISVMLNWTSSLTR